MNKKEHATLLNAHPKTDIQYRSDIDGLRAIAVGAVIGFHAFPGRISGGFAGVDVFFVISGFLISSIILKTEAQRTFSIIDFYARRIRRIFPALLTMLFSCMFAGWLILFPDELAQLGKHVLAAVFFVLNFVLWSESGYFDTASELKPLLHLWSLSIEEQFYTLWPVILIFFAKRKHAGLIIAALTAVSFLLCISGWLDKVANFYNPLARAWELLCGSLLAFVQTSETAKKILDTRQSTFKKVSAELLSWTAAALLFISFFFLNKKTPFPGWAALLPTLGTVMLISIGRDTFFNRYLLGNRLMVFGGLISYPLYLWHWPLLSFPRITDGLALPISTRLAAIALAVLFAASTYWLIEKPLRHRKNATSGALLFAALLAAVLGYLFFKGYIHPKQSDELSQKIALAKQDGPFGAPDSKTIGVFIEQQEYRVVGTGKKIILYIGDSNMDQYWQGIETLIDASANSRQAMLTGCGLPILHIQASETDQTCNSTNEKAFSLAANNPDIDIIVLGAQWRGIHNDFYQEGNKLYPLATPDGMKKTMNQLASSIKSLTDKGKTVYLLLTIPGGEEFEPHNLIKRSLLGPHPTVHLEGGISLEEHYKRTESISPLLRETAQRGGAIVLDPADFMCKDQWCSAIAPNGEVIYRDLDHLKGSYSRQYPAFIGQTLHK